MKIRDGQWTYRVLIVFSFVLVVIAGLTFFQVGPGIESVALIVAAGSALFSAISSQASLDQAKAAREQVEQMQQPNIMAYFDFAGPVFVKFEVMNTGNAPAMDISVVFKDPAPIGYKGLPLGYSDSQIGFLAPGQRISQLFGSNLEILHEGKLGKYQAAIDYRGPNNKQYSSAVTYDLSYMKGALVPDKSIEQSLAEIAKTIAGLSKSR